ncbi:MAG: sulfotransferase [Actinomycetota bacterium]|nr:sulfotransferase [Actinomycetota bacterium]
MDGRLGFMIVGTPRSGTTLVQRLACEIPGVAVPPETHFLYFFAADLYRRRRFPLDAEAIRAEVELYLELGNSRDLEVDPAAIAEDLGGECRSILDLFAALVRHLAGPAEVYGEKTPAHVVWWDKLAAAAPWMKFVAVVRHPAAVVASWVEAWPHESWAAAAERWRLDQLRIAEMARALGPRRALVLRYEDVVGDPDGARRAVAQLLGRDAPAVAARPNRPLYLPWETWKRRSLECIDSARADAWRTALSPEQVDHVTRVCREGMAAFGYDPRAAAGEAAGRDERKHAADVERCRREREAKLREASETPVD